jgi:decaprenyl-phosphate phosphoribosyltransferase
MMPLTVTGARPYVAIARIDHWFKNVFVLPGIVVALYVEPQLADVTLLLNAAIALLAMGFIASSYYTMNEILDAPQDALHPTKSARPIPSGLVNLKMAWASVLILASAGFILGAAVNASVLATLIVLWLMACAYNMPPLRTKDKPYLDVLSEAINNPLRLLVGWYCTGIEVAPPLSLVLAYWMVGAFFMAVKRFAEYRRINDPERAAAYRRSFRHYNDERLLVSITYYGVAFGLFFGIFLIRYRIELIASIPLIAGFIAWYIRLGFLPDSPTQYPERLFRQSSFTAYAVLCVVVILGLLFVDLPIIEELFAPKEFPALE